MNDLSWGQQQISIAPKRTPVSTPQDRRDESDTMTSIAMMKLLSGEKKASPSIKTNMLHCVHMQVLQSAWSVFTDIKITLLKPLYCSTSHARTHTLTHRGPAWPLNPSQSPLSTLHRSALPVCPHSLFSGPLLSPLIISLFLPLFLLHFPCPLSLTCHLTIWSHLLLLIRSSLYSPLLHWRGQRGGPFSLIHLSIRTGRVRVHVVTHWIRGLHSV